MNEVPLVVYLDSSDYSNLSNPEMLAKNRELAEIRNRLKSWIESDSIEIRYSAITVSEIAHLNARSKEMALHRAKLIREYCGGGVIEAFPTIHLKECKALALDKKLSSSEFYNDRGDWLPAFVFKRGELLRELEITFNSQLQSKGMNRKERRQMLKKTFIRGKLGPEGKNLLDGLSYSDVPSIGDYFPRVEGSDISHLFKKCVLGEITERKFTEALTGKFLEIEYFIDSLIDKEGFDRTPKWLRELGSENSTKTIAMRDKISKLYEMESAQGVGDNQIQGKLRAMTNGTFGQQRRKILDNKWRKNEEYFKKAGVSFKIWNDRVLDSETGTLPSFDCYGECLEEYLKDSCLRVQRPRKLMPSDTADLFHSYYIPYVDYFRCDKYMEPILRRGSSKYQTQVFGKLSAMIDAIAKALH